MCAAGLGRAELCCWVTLPLPHRPHTHAHTLTAACRKGSKEKRCPQTRTITGVVMLSRQNPAVSGMCGAGMALLSLGLLHCAHIRQGSMDNPSPCYFFSLM